jgi:outer membrane protein assembly factor BamA
MRKIVLSLGFKFAAVVLTLGSLVAGSRLLSAKAQDEPEVVAVVREEGDKKGPTEIEEVVYRNVHHISQKDLEAMMPDVRKGLPMDPVANRKAAQAIQDCLKNEKGRYWATVVLEEGSNETDRRVVFNISEGPVLRVRSTTFVGGDSLASSARLRTQINTSRSHRPFGGVFTEAVTESDVETLKNYFVSNGYRDAKVTRELRFSQDYSMVDVIFHIDEGMRYKIGGVEILQNTQLSDLQLKYAIQQKPCLFYNETVAKAEEDKSPLAHANLAHANLATETLEKTPSSTTGNYNAQQSEPTRVGKIYILGGHTVVHEAPRYPEVKIGEGLNRSDLFEIKANEITEIAVEGNKNVPYEKVMNYLLTCRGMLPDDAMLAQDTQRLLDSKLFNAVSTEIKKTDDGVALTIHVVEPTVVEAILFENASHLSNHELLDLARCCGVERDKTCDPEANRRACKEIQAEFVARGYHWATVKLTEGTQTADTRVVFDINEGPLVHIRSISFAGNDNLNADKLRARIDDRMFLQDCKGVYLSLMVDELDHEVEHLYQSHGYCDARVEHSVCFDHSYDEADLTFKIKEGRHYRVKQWLVDAVVGSIPAELTKAVQIKTGEFYDERLARADVDRIADCYRKLGRSATVALDLSCPQPGFVQVRFAITEQLAIARQRSNPDTVADVVIEGNANVPTAQVMSFMQTRPGMRFDETVIHDDARRLFDSNLFKYVSMHREMGGDGVVVHVCLDKGPRPIQEVVYQNVQNIGLESLEKLTKIEKGMPLDPVANLLACKEIQEFLKKKGRHWARVTLDEGNRITDKRVVFNVNEGPLVKVHSLTFTGNKNMTDEELQQQLVSTRTCLGCLGVFSDAAVQDDVKKLEEFYKDKGFREVKISRQLLFSEDRCKVDVTFRIEEGATVGAWIDGFGRPRGNWTVQFGIVPNLVPNAGKGIGGGSSAGGLGGTQR